MWVFWFVCYFLSFFSSIHAKCLSDQRSYLLPFGNAVVSHQDDSLYRSLNWNESMDCCKWEGVVCDDVGHVISLYLDHQVINTWSTNQDWKSIFKLQYLEDLHLPQNNFNYTTFPVELYNLTRLKYLNLSESHFTGQIPIGLSNLTSLVTLDLTRNLLEVKNPGVLFQNLTQLKQLYLYYLDLSAGGNAWCNVISSMSKLQVLSLRRCQLSGPIFPSLSNLSSLNTIQLDNNPLDTTILFDYFSNFTNLNILSLAETGLFGQFPQKIFLIPTLESLDLSDNRLLGGSLPQFPKTGSLKKMTIRNTNFSGSLPPSIVYLKQLSELDLSFSRFSGAIPSFSVSPKLVYIDLSHNAFTGPIPSFSISPKLVQIDLSHNAFTGALSSTHFKDLIDLEYVDLSDNSLSGSFPSSLFALPSLQYLVISNNHFDGEIEEFQNASSTSLVKLDLSYNNFIGPIPKSFFYLKSIKYLDLSFNSFNGTLGLDMFNKLENLIILLISHNNLSIDASCSTTSTCLSSSPQLRRLGLASCNLKMFPDLRNQSQMSYLDLSLNSITGKIPNWIWSIGNNSRMLLNLSCNLLVGLQKPFLFSESLDVLDLHANLLMGEIPVPRLRGWSAKYLDFSNNNFNSSIPSNIGEYIFNTMFFSVSHNNIQGDIPKSICNGTSLEVLNLSNNFLRGKIPKCLGGSQLGRNISDTFRHNCELRTLDLSRNRLRGKIPTSLANCKSLQVLNVRNNYFEDNFPCTLMKSLSVLVLRSNMFHGEINCSWDIHSLSSLQILDVSYNKFNGVLPPQLFLNCRGMMFVNSTGAPPLQLDMSDALPMNMSDTLRMNMNYQDNVRLIIKGLDLELVRILTIYKTLDFSYNNFQGNISSVIGELQALYTLNLSHNALTGTIPRSFRKLKQLGSLDLSTNQLTGRIPSELRDLTFLSVLNLSYNQLVGEIPDGRQLRTFSNSSFLGNKGLCGFPLTVSCDHGFNNGSSIPGGPSKKKVINWEIVSAALGFSVGIGIIFWLNFLNPAWWQRFNSLIIEFLFLRVFGVDVLERSYRNTIRRV